MVRLPGPAAARPSLALAFLALLLPACSSADPAPADGAGPTIVVEPPSPGADARTLADKDGAGPTIVVEASYPGADAQTVRDTVAAPIEEQVNGVKKMRHMRSRCTSDGKYTLTVTFAPGIEADLAQVLVQNRVAVAEAKLPDAVKQRVTTRKKSSGVLLFVVLSSPKGRFDTLYINDYLRINVKDELLRIKGVGNILMLGERDYSMRLWLDPDKLAALKLNGMDLVTAIAQQNIQAAAGQIGQPPTSPAQQFQLTINTQGRLTKEEEFADIIVKAGAPNQAAGGPSSPVVDVRDVGRTRLGANSADGCVTWNGRPAAALSVYGLGAGHAKDVSAAVRKRVGQLPKKLPEGLRLEAAFDFAATKPAECLRLDVTLPDSASAERTREVLKHCAKILRETKGVKDILSLDGAPLFHAQNEGCLLAGLAPEPGQARGQILSAVRARVRKEIKEAVVRVCDLPSAREFTLGGYPLDLAISGPDRDQVRKLADQLAKRLGKGEKLTDVFASRDSSPRPFLQLDFDRTKCLALGVPVSDVFSALQVYLGSYYVNNFNVFCRTWQVNIQADDLRKQTEALKQLKVNKAKGEMVPITSFVDVRATNEPAVVNRLDMQPMAEVTANLGPGVTAAEVRRLVEDAVGALPLPKDYRVTWLHELPAGP
jgi:multidrug efflux pump subunit AcrB